MSARVYSVLLVLSFAVTLCGQTAKQIVLLKQYANKGSAACSYRLAELAKAGKLSQNKENNEKEYILYFNKALDAGYPKARLEQAALHLESRSARNHQQAYNTVNELLDLPISRDFSKENLFEAYYWMGYCLENGKGCRIDASSAYFYYRLASIVNTKARLAILWQVGKEKDKSIPLDYLYKIYLDDSSADTVANIRNFLSRYDLNNDFAIYLERKLNAGDDAAGKLLAENQWNGDLFPLNLTYALKNYEKAAKAGNAHAALKLAEVYSKIDLGNVKGLRKINIYSALYNIPRNYAKAESYAQLALFDDATRDDASLLMIQLIKQKLQRFKAPPANVASVDLPKVRKSGPPLPPVPGKAVPAGRLNKMALDPALEYVQLRNALFYYHMQIKDYKNARKILDEDGGNEFHSKHIYLKAKEFYQTQNILLPEVRRQYNDRIRMAANAGYPLAIYEYYLSPEFANVRTSVNYSKLIEAALQMPYPQQSQWHWNLGMWFMQPGPDRDPGQALACIRQAADMGNPDALEYLMKAYQNGNPALKISRNGKQSEKYRKLLLKHDIHMTKPMVFVDYLNNFKPDQKISAEDFNILFRAIGHSPLATYQYAQMRFTGNRSLKIKKHAELAMNLLHFAVDGNMKQRAITEIQKRYPQLIGVSEVSNLMHYEQKMVPLYKKIR